MLITLTPGSTGRRKDYFSWRTNLGGSPTNSRGSPHKFKRWPPPRAWHGSLAHVALWSVRPTKIQEVAPPRAWRGILVCVALSSIQDSPDASMIVRYILVIPTPGMLRQTPVWPCY